jgi:hypothetical protein
LSVDTMSRSIAGATASGRSGARVSASALSSSSESPMILPGRTPISISRLIARSFAVSASVYCRSPLSSRAGLGKL